ncbi:preprotein translocase subunit SecG [Candidatus Saccharibacteria bacterium]|nr:preprotein translocase subunit SecG [Candidatus Saccharibacteria bacterium]
MKSIYDWAVIFEAVIISLLILVQVRGASLGAGMGGGGGDINTVRRGSDKTLHQFTVICVIIFVASILASILA